MDARQLFKFAFMMAAARDGLSEQETLERAKLRRDDPTLKQALLDQIPVIGPVLNSTPALLMGAGLAVAGAGAAGGHILARAGEKQLTPEDAKRQELIAAFNTASNEIELANKYHQVQHSSPRGSGHAQHR